jgi:hypothetical protein
MDQPAFRGPSRTSTPAPVPQQRHNDPIPPTAPQSEQQQQRSAPPAQPQRPQQPAQDFSARVYDEDDIEIPTFLRKRR